MQSTRQALQRRAILWGTLLSVAALSVTVAGCGSSSGRRVSNGNDTANFAVFNNSNFNLDVIVNDDRLGTIAPGQLSSFRVFSGTRTVHLRESGGERLYFGTYDFFNDRILRIDYSTGLRNLEVTNNTQVTVNVVIDGFEVEGVEPLTTSILVVRPGLHDVHFRERGSSTLDFVGLIDFPPAALTGGVVLSYGP